MTPKAILNRLVLAPVAVLLCCATSASALKGPERAAKLATAIPKIEKTLVVRNGSVVINSRRAASLSSSERVHATALVDNLNGRIRRGAIKVDSDLKVIASSPELASLRTKDVSCDTHWWGVECSLDATTTRDILVGLEAGDAAETFCDFFPGIDLVCAALELAGVSFELELEPCVDSNDGSVLQVAWTGGPYFTCSELQCGPGGEVPRLGRALPLKEGWCALEDSNL